MSDMEEPPVKVLKMDVAPSSLDSTMEGQEEGQEEWLSEGVLTDDDYIANSSQEQVATDANTAETTQNPEPEPPQESQVQASVTMEQNIEETLNNFEGMETSTKLNDPANVITSEQTLEPVHQASQPLETQNIEDTLNDMEGVTTAEPTEEPMDATTGENQDLEPHPHEHHEPLEIILQHNIEDTLNNFESAETTTKDDAFNELLKKDSKENEPSPSEHSDDGHNTDELLRMLGEDNSKKKKVLTTIREKNSRRAARSSEDDYFLEGAKVTQLKVAKNAIIRKQPMKAEPEDFDSDMSDDEENTVKRMFTSKSRPTGGRAQKSFTNVKTEKPKPTSVKQYTNISNKSLLKPQLKEHPEIINDEEFLEDEDFDLDDPSGSTILKKISNTNNSRKSLLKTQLKDTEIINDEELLEDDDCDLDNDIGDEWQHDDDEPATKKTQPIRRPERMDEEVPSDDDSNSEDDSLYDVLPSSDSEDMDDWFTLDIRAERAGDYLPWLGDKAHKLLTEEKQRVSSRLTALRQSVTALQSSGRVQSDQIKVATEALHELDAMLAAA